MRFRGVVCPIDKPSVKAAYGSRGRTLVITRRCAEESMRSLVGAPLTYHATGSHKAAEVIGRIEKIWCSAEAVEIEGALNVCPEYSKPLGLSFEVSGATLEDYKARPWRLKAGDFHTVMVGPQSRVAFGKATSFEVLK